ncbi:unnamed protein product [Timema podura]|uniref:Uncharacterized protein n=1 Tax=Timema podura TaxID=61482 RepID=A0ABN7PML1_TIMPD|nr:unnamed protein product [Timema podura]
MEGAVEVVEEVEEASVEVEVLVEEEATVGAGATEEVEAMGVEAAMEAVEDQATEEAMVELEALAEIHSTAVVPALLTSHSIRFVMMRGALNRWVYGFAFVVNSFGDSFPCLHFLFARENALKLETLRAVPSISGNVA